MAARAACVLVCFGALVQVRALRMIGIKVPEITADQKEVQLECRFHVETQEYFKMANWYKDGKLLLSCLPEGTHRRHSIKGIHIHYRGFDPIGICDFKLQEITEKALGVYKCEAVVYHPHNAGVWEFATLSRKTEGTVDENTVAQDDVNEATTEYEENGVTDHDSTESSH